MKDEPVSLGDHLEELRRRVIVCGIAVLVAWAGCYAFAGDILFFISQPVGDLVFIAPHEAFFSYLKVSFLTGVLVALPVILWQVWAFVSAGLMPGERRSLMMFVPVMLVLFLIGGGFALFAVIPVSIRFLLGFATDQFRPMIAVSQYISFVGVLVMAFGIAFNLPVAVLALSLLGIVTPLWLRRKRKHVILSLLILSAILTPPEAFTQFLLAIPLAVLYEISIWLAELITRKRSRKTASR